MTGSDAASATITVQPLAYFPPSESAGGWRALVTRDVIPDSAAKSEILSRTGVDWDLLEEAWDYSQALATDSTVLVIRNGWIVGEWGYGGDYHVASVTKSLTGLAVAKLFDLSDQGQFGQPIGPESLAYEFLPPSFAASDALKQQITIRQLLTMSSGIRPADADLLTLEERLTQPMDANPGEEWTYSSLGPNLLSMIVENRTGISLGSFFNSSIAGAVGATPLNWGTVDGGYTDGSAWVDTSARNLARIAYLTLNGGAWDNGGGNAQVVSGARVSALTQWDPLLAGAVFRATPGSDFTVPIDAPNHYAQLWWTNLTGVALGSSVPGDAYFMHGYLDNLAIVVPSRQLIVIRLANGGPGTEPAFRSEFMQRVMAALIN